MRAIVIDGVEIPEALLAQEVQNHPGASAPDARADPVVAIGHQMAQVVHQTGADELGRRPSLLREHGALQGMGKLTDRLAPIPRAAARREQLDDGFNRKQQDRAPSNDQMKNRRIRADTRSMTVTVMTMMIITAQVLA